MQLMSKLDIVKKFVLFFLKKLDFVQIYLERKRVKNFERVKNFAIKSVKSKIKGNIWLLN